MKIRTLCLGVALALGSLPVLAEDLMEIYQLARDNDPTLRAAEAARRAADEVRPQARASAMLPTLDLSANLSETRVHEPDTTNPSRPASAIELNLTQPILHLDRLARLRQADSQIAQAEAQYQATRQDLMIRVAESYFNVLAAIDSLEYARAQKSAIGRQLEQATKRFEVGLIAITDVHEAQAGYDLASADEIVAQDALSSAREALAEITGQFIKELAGLKQELKLTPPDPADADRWTTTALEQNLAILAAAEAVTTAREEIEARRGGHYPTLDLTASHGAGDNDALYTSGYTQTEQTAVSLQFNLPLFRGGATNSQVRQASQLYNEAREKLESARRTATRSSRDAYRGVVAAISRVEALKQALVSTESALEATQAGFEVGTRTIVDVLNSQRDLHQARRDYARARYDYLLNTLRLKQAAGIIQESDLESVNRWLQ
ncbi:TolC family outer membrane protein [Endothiovibrio diazotrophicus]